MSPGRGRSTIHHFQRGSYGLLCQTMKNTPWWFLFSSCLTTHHGDRVLAAENCQTWETSEFITQWAGRMNCALLLETQGEAGVIWNGSIPHLLKNDLERYTFFLSHYHLKGVRENGFKSSIWLFIPSVHFILRVSFMLTWRNDSRKVFEIWLQIFLNSITSQAGTVITTVIKQFEESGSS